MTVRPTQVAAVYSGAELSTVEACDGIEAIATLERESGGRVIRDILSRT